MSTDIFNPIPFSQCLAAVFLAILFLQSGIDKVTDFAGNLSWLQGHFAKTPFRGQVRNMLVTITIAETLAGALCAVGALRIHHVRSVRRTGGGHLHRDALPRAAHRQGLRGRSHAGAVLHAQRGCGDAHEAMTQITARPNAHARLLTAPVAW